MKPHKANPGRIDAVKCCRHVFNFPVILFPWIAGVALKPEDVIRGERRLLFIAFIFALFRAL